MGSDLIIRPVQSSDWEDVTDFLVDERTELNRDLLEAAQLARSIMLGVEEGDDLVLLAKDGPFRVAGFAALTRGRKKSDRHTAVLRIHLKEEYRGLGAGSELMQELTDWADAAGVVRIVATPYVDRETDDISTRKTEFFKKHGFRVEGWAPKFARLPDGSYTDAALMARVTEPSVAAGGSTDGAGFASHPDARDEFRPRLARTS